MRYQIHDTYGAPQCGCEIVEFASWWELEDYIENTEGLFERIKNGYAVIKEID